MAIPVLTNATESGNNTAQATWSVAFPAYATGDLVLVFLSWDDSTTVTAVTAPTGPNGETFTKAPATAYADSGTTVRGQVLWTIATGSWSAGDLTFTPSASEQWTAVTAKVEAGTFDATLPIGASTTAQGSGSSVSSGAFTVDSMDGGGLLVWHATVDDDPLVTLSSGWTPFVNRDRGAVALGIATRDTAVTNSESVTAGTWSIASDTWVSFSFVVREGPPAGGGILDIRATNSAWGYQDGSGYNNADGQMFMPAAKATWGNILFTLDIPQGSVIDQAELIVYARNNLTWSSSENITLGADQLDDATLFSSGDYTSRYTDYSTTVTWLPLSLGSVTNGNPIDGNADIKAVIQEITDRGGWVSGNDLGIILNAPLDADFGGSWHDHTNATVALRPRLRVKYSPAAALEVLPSAITSAEAVPSATVSPGPVALSPGGIATAEVAPSPSLTTAFTFSVTSVGSAEAFGSAGISTGPVSLTPNAIASAEASGSPALTVGVVVVGASAISSLEAFGTATLESFYSIVPAGIASAEAFGDATLSTLIALIPSAIASGEAFGSHTLQPGPVSLLPVALQSQEAVPSPALGVGAVLVVPSGITPQELFGTHQVLVGGVNLVTVSISPSEAFGDHIVQVEAAEGFLLPIGVASDEEFGNATFITGVVVVLPDSIDSEESVGSPALFDAGEPPIARPPFTVGKDYIRLGE